MTNIFFQPHAHTHTRVHNFILHRKSNLKHSLKYIVYVNKFITLIPRTDPNL